MQGTDLATSTPAYANPWLGIRPGIDPVGWAEILRKAHRLALRRQTAPSVVRPIVSQSWRRAAERGVSPSGSPPLVFGERELREQLTRHPLGKMLPAIQRMLIEAMEGAGYFAALSDPEGVLLWVRDDGVGGARPDGNGLIGLCARVAVLDGRLTVESPPGAGTSISAEIPLSV